MGSTGAVQRFQVACQNEKCQVQSPLISGEVKYLRDRGTE